MTAIPIQKCDINDKTITLMLHNIPIIMINNKKRFMLHFFANGHPFYCIIQIHLNAQPLPSFIFTLRNVVYNFDEIVFDDLVCFSNCMCNQNLNFFLFNISFLTFVGSTTSEKIKNKSIKVLISLSQSITTFG